MNVHYVGTGCVTTHSEAARPRAISADAFSSKVDAHQRNDVRPLIEIRLPSSLYPALQKYHHYATLISIPLNSAVTTYSTSHCVLMRRR